MNEPIKEPFLGPELPLYPELPQLVKVTGSTGTAAYTGFVQQYQPDLTFRDREACYVFEPNGAILLAGKYYDCRLVGNYIVSGTALPLYATTCCP